MKKLISFLLLSSAMAHASIIPVDNPEKLVADELLSYQWGLLNEGQTMIREKDDIHNMPMKGVSGKDIGWRNLVGKSGARRPIVAVLDSGVDLNHPELQGNLWKNEKECGKDPSEDNDKNHLKGDCHGWNFTELIDSKEAKDPSDKDGHGTHIAGIIAALNNGSGMVGVAPNALIMPVKVMKDSDSDSTVPSSESFAFGIRYAVDNGADVINMSLGWPLSLETDDLRKAVQYALERGVPIVAAAGNNNSSEPLYPCAYDGVICVGATTINGKFASFSNFGGHVDTLAPGEGILGLHPSLLEPDLFPVTGFELRSGTSQSAPFVAGMIAALKSKNKNLTIDEIFAKLYQAEAVQEGGKYINGGDAVWSLLDAEVAKPVIRPIFKRRGKIVPQVIFEGENLETKIGFAIRNFGLPASDIKVKAVSLSKAIDISSDEHNISSLGQGEVKNVDFIFTVKDLTAESSVIVKIIIENGGRTYSYTTAMPVMRDLYGDSGYKKSTFVFKGKPIATGKFENGVLIPSITTLDSYGPSKKHEFFMKRTKREEKEIEILLLTKKGNQYFQSDKMIKIENALVLVNFARVDLNFDGKEDYIVQTFTENEEEKFFTYSFYDEDLNPLWDDFHHVKLKLDAFVKSLNDLFFMKYNHPKHGDILVPAYFTEGMLPKADQKITSWEKYDTSKKSRLYYLEPQENKFRIRSLTTNIWEENVKKELKSKWFESVVTEQILPPSEEDKKKGQLRVLVSVGMSSRRQLFIHTFDTALNTHGKKLPQLVLQSSSVDPLLKVSPEGLQMNGETFFNVYDRTRAKIVTTKGESQDGEYIFRHETDTDIVAGHISSFENGGNRFSVIQTREELISITTGDEAKRSSRAKLRYSFLSQKLLSEMYYPVSYKRDEVHRPALYVDSTSVTLNRIYLFEEQNGELVSSIRNSVIVPNRCRAMNPVWSTDTETYEFVFLCIEDRQFVIRSYEMN